MGAKRGRSILESYKHRAAKVVLKSWLEAGGFEVRTEVELNIDGWKFYPDLVTYIDGHIQAFYEIVHRHPVDGRKLSRMQHYCWDNHLEILCHEVDAEWVLLQVEKPERIVEFIFDLNPKTKI
jgi:hypothetical protein